MKTNLRLFLASVMLVAPAGAPAFIAPISLPHWGAG